MRLKRIAHIRKVQTERHLNTLQNYLKFIIKTYEYLRKSKFISTWIKNYVDNMPSKAKALVIGISGGIDSSVSSTLSAMTGLRTIVLSMPIKQKSHQHDLSLKHQEWLIKKF